MARELNFKLSNSEFSLIPTKIERRKIYGWTETKAVDSNGNSCMQVGLDSNGINLISSGSIKLGIIGDDGDWVEKSELQAVHSDGTPAELCPSSFDSPIILKDKATNEDLLDLIVSSVYQLSGDSAEECAKIIGNEIYSFRFNYRSDYEDAPAFLISNGKDLFIITGQKANFEYLSLEESANVSDFGEDDVDIEDDELDFSMM